MNLTVSKYVLQILFPGNIVQRKGLWFCPLWPIYTLHNSDILHPQGMGRTGQAYLLCQAEVCLPIHQTLVPRAPSKAGVEGSQCSFSSSYSQGRSFLPQMQLLQTEVACLQNESDREQGSLGANSA